MSEDPFDRGERIDSIVDAIRSGTYEVDDLDVADAVLERWRMFDVLTPVSSAETSAEDQPVVVDAFSDDSSR